MPRPEIPAGASLQTTQREQFVVIRTALRAGAEREKARRAFTAADAEYRKRRGTAGVAEPRGGHVFAYQLTQESSISVGNADPSRPAWEPYMVAPEEAGLYIVGNRLYFDESEDPRQPQPDYLRAMLNGLETDRQSFGRPFRLHVGERTLDGIVEVLPESIPESEWFVPNLPPQQFSLSAVPAS